MYGIEHKLLAILASILILGIAFIVRAAAGIILIPAGIFAIVWFIFTFFPLVILFKTPINSGAILYIAAAVLVFSLSALPFNWKNALRYNRRKSLSIGKFDSQFLTLTLCLSVVASASLSILTMLNNGVLIEQIAFDLIRTSGQFAATRGNDGMEYGVIGQLSILFTYLSPLLGGLRALAPKSGKFFIFSLIPCLITMVTQSSKLVFLISLCFYFSGAIVAKIYANKMQLPKPTGLPKLILGTLLLSLLVLVSFVSRLGDFEFNNIDAILDPLIYSITSYTQGQIYAFADFFSYTMGAPSASTFKNDYHSYGAYTFASISEMLGFGKDFPPGMYLETGYFKDTFETNIFTFFRGLIYDFGILGSLLFLFFFGLLAHATTYQLLVKKRAWLLCAVFIALLVFIFMGYLVSVFTARYVFLNATAVWALLHINTHTYRKRATKINTPVNLTIPP